MRRCSGFAALCGVLIIACSGIGNEPIPGQPAHHVVGGFRNVNPDFRRPSAWTRWSFVVRRFLSTSFAPTTFHPPRNANDGAILRAGEMNPSITWVGHATVLVQINGVNILTDPQWSERASPVSWGGPRRMSPPGLAFEDLPRIHVVLISHDHYDHLDLDTVKRLCGARSAISGSARSQGMVCRERNDASGRNGLVAGARIPRAEICLRAGPAFLPTNVNGRQPVTVGLLVGVERAAAVLFLRRYGIFHFLQGNRSAPRSF